jgi:hypothetical protein
MRSLFLMLPVSRISVATPQEVVVDRGRIAENELS